MDTTTKKKVLQLFPSPIFVIGCAHREAIHAFGGSWLGQCSFDPPIVWVGVRKGSRPETLLDVGRIFTISLLRADQIKMAKVFFKTPEPKHGHFGKVPFHLSPKGAPILDDCRAWVECRVVKKTAPGDHILYYGEVVACGLDAEGEGEVLTTVTSGLKYGG
jgi:flavin reductase (DIM6/NTAB) family NADH-FMN oxidoreductase RutF